MSKPISYKKYLEEQKTEGLPEKKLEESVMKIVIEKTTRENQEEIKEAVRKICKKKGISFYVE